MKVLIAVDGSEYTRRLLDYVVASGWLRSVRSLTVLTVVLPLPHRAAAFATRDMVESYYRDDADSVLRPVREFLASHGIQAVCRHEIGHPAQLIAHAATENDLVMMGSHGHGIVANLVLGSVATKVLAWCKTPVLLIR